MSADIERYLNSTVPDRLDSMADRFPQPNPFSRAGMLDRADANNHLRKLRNVARRIELEAAEMYADTQRAIREIDADDQLTTKVKLILDQQERLSEGLGGSPESRAKNSVLDDDQFQRRRQALMGFRRPSGL